MDARNFNPDNGDDDDGDDRSGANMVVLIVAVVIIVVGSLVVWGMKHESNLEDCYAAGHRNCAPVDTQPSQ